MTEGEGKKTQVLLVEDNLTDAILVRSLLEQDETIRVTLAQDGIRGCQLVENQRWDLVVTDINLPGRDGIEVIQECKLHQPETPIIAVSAYATPAYREEAYRSGANEVLTKPMNRDEFLQAVKVLVAAKARLDSRSRRILAIGALPGDVEAGCGGTLIKHALAGDEVTILVLATGAAGEESEARRAAAGRAARVIGAKIKMAEHESEEIADLEAMILQIQDAVRDLEPEVIFAPSAQDVRDSRKHAHQAADISAGRIPEFFSYQAATTTLEFRPSLFEDISAYLDQKMAALSHYDAQVRGRPHLDPGLARATARYWGRFLGYGEVEPLEVVRHTN